jgi:hypothetical protein
MIDLEGNTEENPMLALTEVICIAWFTLEYLLRYSIQRCKNTVPKIRNKYSQK